MPIKSYLGKTFWGRLDLGIRRVKEQFLRFGKILPHPQEFDYELFARGGELGKKTCPDGRDSLAQNIFSGVAGGGGVSSWN